MEAASDLLLKFGRLPERPKGADCKSAGNAYGGSNPSSATERKTSPDLRKRRSGEVFSLRSGAMRGQIGRSCSQNVVTALLAWQRCGQARVVIGRLRCTYRTSSNPKFLDAPLDGIERLLSSESSP